MLLLRLLVLLAGLVPALASAHPHVWIRAAAELVYGDGGTVTAVRHRWTFDPGYSAFAVQGLDKNRDGQTTPDEMAELAAFMTQSVAEFGYFTSLRAGGTRQDFGRPHGETLALDKGLLTLSYELPLKAPAPGRTVVMDVSDKTFFVQFETADGSDPVTLAGAPAGCKVIVSRPKPPAGAADPAKLGEEFFQQLNNAAAYAAQLASRATVACP